MVSKTNRPISILFQNITPVSARISLSLASVVLGLVILGYPNSSLCEPRRASRKVPASGLR